MKPLQEIHLISLKIFFSCSFQLSLSSDGYVAGKYPRKHKKELKKKKYYKYKRSTVARQVCLHKNVMVMRPKFKSYLHKINLLIL